MAPRYAAKEKKTFCRMEKGGSSKNYVNGDIYLARLANESALGADDRPVLCNYQGTLPWQPNNVGRNEKVMNAD